MHRQRSLLVASILFGVALSGCNGGQSTPPPSPIGNGTISLKTVVALPNLPPGGKFSNDIGFVDLLTHRYYLADRTNASLDIIDTTTFAVRLVPGFTGVKATNDLSGPDGVAAVPGGLVYVGDVNTVKVVDPVAGSIVKTIATGTASFRTDEGCFDPADNLMMFANPADSPPYTTWISTGSNTIAAKLLFSTSIGLEQCVYDPGTKNFLVNNDGTPANPHGEIDVIPAASVVAGTPAIAAVYPLGNCGPAGMALGPNEQMVVGCDAPAGSPQITLIVNATNGSIVKTITQVGGEDQVAYDPLLKHYYTASRDWTANGISVTGNAGATFTPVLGVIDAQTNTWIGNIPTVTNSHSVAVDPNTGNVYVPLAPTATVAGGVAVYGP
jgi:hypothetical protein